MARRETEDALLWAPQGYNCIHSDSTLGLWMHRCTVAEQCNLIAATCATSNVPLHALIYYYIRMEGSTGQLSAGPLLKSERDVAHTYTVVIIASPRLERDNWEALLESISIRFEEFVQTGHRRVHLVLRERVPFR